MKTKLKHYFPAGLVLALAATLAAVAPAADPAKKPDVTLPPFEMKPTAYIAFTKSQTEDVVDWSATDANIPGVWAKGITGKGGVGAIIDTGTDPTHPDLVGQELSGKDFSGKGSSTDGNGHGTWCFGHVFAKKDSKGTVGGAYGAKGRTYKALSDQGSGYTSDIAKAIDAAVADDVDGASMSLGSPQPDADTLAAIKRGGEAGVLFVCAAGNDGPGNNTVGYPGGYAANLPNVVVCVAAHDSNGATATFSSRGQAVTITLGGVNTKSTWLNGQYAAISGTSMATPTALSLYLLWLEAKGRKLTKKDRPQAFLADLTKSCDLYPQRNVSRGYGKPDAVKLCAVTDPTPTDPAPTDPSQPPGYRAVRLDWTDLTPAAQKKLTDAGIVGWNTTIAVGTPPATGSTAQTPAPAQFPLSAYGQVQGGCANGKCAVGPAPVQTVPTAVPVGVGITGPVVGSPVAVAGPQVQFYGTSPVPVQYGLYHHVQPVPVRTRWYPGKLLLGVVRR